MTRQDMARLFPGLCVDGYDGSPDAVARRKVERDAEHQRVMSQYFATKAQSILDMQVPPENRGDRFDRFDCEDNPDRQAMLEVCRRFAANPDGRTLVLIGGCGRGKTLLAVSIARVYLEAHLYDISPDSGLVYVTEQSLLERYDRARSYKSLESTDAVMRRYSSCGLLIIDELGKWSPSRDGLAVLEQLVDHRIGLKPTIMLSNLSQADFSARYTGGFLSRVADSCYALTGHDHRIGCGKL